VIDRVVVGWFGGGMRILIITCSFVVGLYLIYLAREIPIISGFTSNVSLVIYLCVSYWYFGRLHDEKEKRRSKLKEEKLRKQAKEQARIRAIEDAQLRNHQLTQTCPAIVQKLQSTGFSSLDQSEKKYLFKLSDQMGNNLENLHENEVKDLEVAFSNQGVYNMLQMRSNQLQPNNQAALSQLKGIKYASMVSGVKAAREMGEEMGESFSE